MKRTKTISQRKRACKDAYLVALLLLMWVPLLVLMLRTWAEHPAEQPINGYDYIQSISGDPDALP